MHKNPLRALENLLKTPKDPQSNSSKKSLRIPNKSSKTTLYFKTKQLQNPHRGPIYEDFRRITENRKKTYVNSLRALKDLKKTSHQIRFTKYG